MNTTGHKKDGDSMCLAFETMVDKVETMFQCIVVAFVTDNDGGSCSGRTKLVVKRPWLFGLPCCGHQVCRKGNIIEFLLKSPLLSA